MSGENEVQPTHSSKSATRKTRGAAVPTINLEKALEFTRKIWDHERRNAAPVSAVLSHWGYGAKSSGGFQAVASLKRFGLVDEQGSGDKRTVKLSPLSLDLLKNEATNAEEYQRLLKISALRPKHHQLMWTKYGEELPSPATMESHLVFDLHFSEDTAKQFIKQYKETIGFAKLRAGDTFQETESDDDESVADTNSKSDKQPSGAALGSPIITSPPGHPSKSPPASPTPLMSPSLRYLSIPLDIGDAPIPVGMSEDDFDLLLETLQLWKKKIVAREVHGVWHTDEGDVLITIVGKASPRDGQEYYRLKDGREVPASEVSFSGQILP